MNEDYEEREVSKIFGMQIKKQPKKVEFTSIDNLIDWDDDEEWQEKERTFYKSILTLDLVVMC